MGIVERTSKPRGLRYMYKYKQTCRFVTPILHLRHSSASLHPTPVMHPTSPTVAQLEAQKDVPRIPPPLPILPTLTGLPCLID